MSDISPIGRSNAAYEATAATSRAKEDANKAPSRGKDQVQLSNQARLLSKLNELPEIRQELVDRVRAQIEEGSYETPEKIDAAIEGLIEDIA